MSISKGVECPECHRVTDVLDSAGAGLIRCRECGVLSEVGE